MGFMLGTQQAQSRVAVVSQQYGSYSGGHGHHKQCDNGISLAILLTTLAGIGTLFFILFTRITMAPGRRRRRRKRGSSFEDYDPDAWDMVDEELGFLDTDGISDIIFGGTSPVVFTASVIACFQSLPLTVASLRELPGMMPAKFSHF